MPRTLTLTHDYSVDPDRLFALASDLDALEAVSRPWIQFDHLPSGPVRTGQIVDVAVSLFGLFPAQPYRMHVVLCDLQRRILRSDEDGMGVRRLRHEVQVSATKTGARLVDRIEIDAGWKTPLVVVWARFLYRRRHFARLRLLNLT